MSEAIRLGNIEDGFEIAGLCGVIFNPGVHTVIASIVDGKLRGGAVFTDYQRNGSVQIHAAGRGGRWITRGLLHTVYTYAFEHLGCRKVINPVPGWNERSLILTSHLGYRVEAVIRDALADDDMVIFTMYKADCRFLGMSPRELRIVDGTRQDGKRKRSDPADG